MSAEVDCSAEEELLLNDDENLIYDESGGDDQDVNLDDREVDDLLADRQPEDKEEKPEDEAQQPVKKSTAPTVYVDSRSRGGYGRGYGGYWGRGPPPGFFRGMRPPIPMPPYGMGPRRPFGPRGPPGAAISPRDHPSGDAAEADAGPHLYRGRGPRPRYVGPPRFEDTGEEEMEEEEESTSSGPKPLMSIKTPVTIKRAVDYAKGAEAASGRIPSGMGLGPRFHPSLRRGSSASLRGSDTPYRPERPSLKRPAEAMGAGDSYVPRGRGGYSRGGGAPPPYTPHEPPPPKVMMTQQNTQVHSNLRQIQTVDDQRTRPPPRRFLGIIVPSSRIILRPHRDRDLT